MSNSIKRVLLVTQYFYPENFKSNDIAFELKKRGYEIDVLAGIPNYPEGKYFKGYNFFQKRVEKIDGVRVFRAFQMPRGNNNKIRLTINYLSYAFCASVWAFFLSMFVKYNCVIVHQTSPITQGFPAVIVKKIQKISMYFWVLDLWPEAIISGANLNKSFILNFLEKVVKCMYNNSEKILISSYGFMNSIANKGDYSEKIIYFPNWSIDFKEMSANFSIPEMPQGFIIMLAGNLGRAQDLKSVVKLANELKEIRNIKFVIIGDGSAKKWLDKSIIESNLQDIMFTYGKFPIDAMPYFYKSADALLLTLSGEYPDLELYIPARLQSYMAAGRPVLAMINGVSKNLVKQANCGYAVNAGDYSLLSQIIKEKILVDLGAFENLGLNGRDFFEKNFQIDICMDNLCEIIK